MTPEQEALGRRAVAAVGDNWRAGMRVKVGAHWGRLVACGERLIHVSEANASDAGFLPEWEGATVLIDVADHATLGCLAALAREALGEAGAYAAHYNGLWTIERDDGEDGEGYHDGGDWGLNGSGDFVSESSEPAAWVAALEAAGRK